MWWVGVKSQQPSGPRYQRRRGGSSEGDAVLGGASQQQDFTGIKSLHLSFWHTINIFPTPFFFTSIILYASNNRGNCGNSAFDYLWLRGFSIQLNIWRSNGNFCDAMSSDCFLIVFQPTTIQLSIWKYVMATSVASLVQCPGTFFYYLCFCIGCSHLLYSNLFYTYNGHHLTRAKCVFVYKYVRDYEPS